jgi:hypothetical protein
VCKRKKDFQKFTFQLRVLTDLRKLRPLFNKKIETMPVLFDIDFKDDPFYLDGMEVGLEKGEKRGVEKGEKKKATLLIEKLLLAKQSSLKYIADFVEETEAFVLSIQNRLIQEGKLPRHD